QGVGADGAYRLGWEPAEPLAEAREGPQGPLLRLLGEPLVGRQASGEPDRLAEGVERVDLVVHHAPDLQAERIRPEVDGGQGREFGHVHACFERARLTTCGQGSSLTAYASGLEAGVDRAGSEAGLDIHDPPEGSSNQKLSCNRTGSIRALSPFRQNEPTTIALMPSRRDHVPETLARVGRFCRKLSMSGQCGCSLKIC